ncbi:MAG TPA: hypothetical protein VL048_11700 [Xanthobacteraceae bacterium]|nr:hypothetical protein [Xanthobacteraceae bacterium]
MAKTRRSVTQNFGMRLAEFPSDPCGIAATACRKWFAVLQLATAQSGDSTSWRESLRPSNVSDGENLDLKNAGVVSFIAVDPVSSREAVREHHVGTDGKNRAIH